MLDRLSLPQARHIAAHAQLHSTLVPDGHPDAYVHLLDKLGCIQLDTISAVKRAHELTMLSRGASAEHVAQSLHQRPEAVAFEFTAHAMSLVPISMWPYMGTRRKLYRTDDYGPSTPDARALADVRAVQKAQGFATVSDFEPAARMKDPNNGWGTPSDHKRALEWQLWTGEVACPYRDGFKRVYVPVEDAVPSQYRWDAEVEEGQDHMVSRAIKALGVATTKDIADYFRMKQAATKATLQRLGLPRVEVDGWTDDTWIDPDITEVPEVDADHAVAVSLFDPLVWYRDRLKRLHGHDWKIEIYVPQAKRTFGYYCLPVYVGAEVPGRLALRRVNGDLVVEAAEWDHSRADEKHLHAAVDTVSQWVQGETVWDAPIRAL